MHHFQFFSFSKFFCTESAKLAKNPYFRSASSVKKAENPTKLLKVMKQKFYFLVLSNQLQRRFLSKQKCILRNYERLFSKTYQIKKNSLTFITRVISWEIQGFLWSPIFRKQSFPVLHILFKGSFWIAGDVFQKTKRGLY